MVKRPALVGKLILTGTGPKGGDDIDKVAGATYYDMFRAALTHPDPKVFLFFTRNATGKPPRKPSWSACRNTPGTVTRRSR